MRRNSLLKDKLKEIEENINAFLKKSTGFNQINIKKITDEYIELGTSEYNITVRLKWIHFSDYLEFENAKDLDKIITYTKSCANDIFYYAAKEKLYCERNLESIKVWNGKLNSFNNRYIQGFFNQGSKLGEFLIEENRNLDLNSNEESEGKLYLKFNIGQVMIEVSAPSQIFRLMFMKINIFGVDSFWNKFLTIKIIGAKKTDLNQYLQQAMFILNIYNNNKLLFGVEDKLRHEPNEYDYTPNEEYLYFEETAYIAPLSYYNEASNLTNEASFLYYYKVLEYFFIICQKDKLKNIIKNYSNVEEDLIKMKNEISEQEKLLRTLRNDNNLINDIGKIYNSQEEICLNKVLEIINSDGMVSKLIKECFWSEMLESDDVGNIDIHKISIKVFGNKLYKYRNSIVHGKSDFKFNSRVPDYLEDYDESIKIESWNYIMQKLALLCIKKFCYNDSSLIKFSIW